VLLGGVAMMALYVQANYRLYRTYNSFNLDCIAMLTENIKVMLPLLSEQIFLFVIYEFVIPHLSLLLGVFIIQSLLRAAVCAHLIEKGLVIQGRRPEHIKE